MLEKETFWQFLFDIKNVCTMWKLMTDFVFVNCPVIKKTSCRFAIDNNFLPLLIGQHGSVTRVFIGSPQLHFYISAPECFFCFFFVEVVL